MKITVQIKPNSRHRQEVIKNPDGTYIVYTKAPAIENKANSEAIELLAQYFGVPKSRAYIVRGATSRHKIVEINTTH